jgi:hypothetical protein
MSSADFLLDWVRSHLPRTKSHAKGWIGFNAICCHHRGERNDTRGRGNILFTNMGFSYNCFNCGFKTSWELGRQLSGKNKQFLNWFGATPEEVKTLAFKCWQMAQQTAPEENKEFEKNDFVLDFESVELPKGSRSFTYWQSINNPGFNAVLAYVNSRGFKLNLDQLYWTTVPGEWAFNTRVTLPITFKKQIIGYVSRSIVPGVKYVKETGNNVNVLFNSRVLANYQRKWICVVEGAFDALAIDGVAVLKNSMSPEQAKWIQDSGQTPILVPDRDKGSKTLVDQALSLGWHVSIPTEEHWEHDIKDVADAAKRYGRIYALRSILESASDNELYIKTIAQKYCR